MALVYVFLFVLMAFIGGVGIGWFLLGLGTIAAAAPVVWSMMREDQRQRILMIFDPSIDPDVYKRQAL